MFKAKPPHVSVFQPQTFHTILHRNAPDILKEEPGADMPASAAEAKPSVTSSSTEEERTFLQFLWLFIL